LRAKSAIWELAVRQRIRCGMAHKTAQRKWL
jgi:hypothetical protein